MRAAPTPIRLRLLQALIVLLLPSLSAACAEPDPHTPVGPQDLARLTEEGHAGLRTLGLGRFEVLDFKPQTGKRVDLSDPFLFRTRLYALGFVARLHFHTRLEVPSPSTMDARIGAPGWTIEESEDALTLHEVLGEGTHEAGTEASITASAMFLDLEPGLRFERVGRAR